jgi:hypothetical protein
MLFKYTSIIVKGAEDQGIEKDWKSVTVPLSVKLATAPRNPLKKYY